MSHSNILHLTEANFDQETLHAKVPVLVDFWAPWCGPCRLLSPVLDAIAEETGERFKICKVNTDEAQSIAGRYGVRSIPTLLLLKNGEVKEQIVGSAVSKHELIAKLEELL